MLPVGKKKRRKLHIEKFQNGKVKAKMLQYSQVRKGGEEGGAEGDAIRNNPQQ